MGLAQNIATLLDGGSLFSSLGGEVGLPPGFAAYQTLLGATLVEGWDVRAGVTVNSGMQAWAGQQRGIVLVESGARPVFAADGSTFGGVPVLQARKDSPDMAMKIDSIGGAPLSASGSRPWVLARYRYRTVPGGGQDTAIVSGGVSGVSNNMNLTARGAASQLRGSINDAVSGAHALEASITDTAVHTLDLWADGTNLNMMRDATLTSVANTAAIAADVTALSIGKLASGGFWYGDVSVALVLWCSAYPGATVAAAVRARVALDFPA